MTVFMVCVLQNRYGRIQSVEESRLGQKGLMQQTKPSSCLYDPCYQHLCNWISSVLHHLPGITAPSKQKNGQHFSI